MRIAVAGGTGWTGKRVVEALEARGDEVVVLARSRGVDLVSGDGLRVGLEGVDTVIDVTNIATQSAERSIEFFGTVSTNLVRAEREAGVRHHVALSIVGCDRVDLNYYLGKRRQEEVVLGGDVPATVLRATQFHEFAAQMLAARGPVVVAPRMLCQPVALVEVSEQLVTLAHGAPLGQAPELAGPEPGLRMEEMITRLAKQQGDRRFRFRVALPGKAGRQIKNGGLLPTGAGPRGRITFDAWLAGGAGA